MNTAIKASKRRRVRMGNCPYCGQVNRIDRKRKGEDIRLTPCVKCHYILADPEVVTWLEDPEAAKGGV